MAALPAYDTSDLVTKSDLLLSGAELRSELRAEISELRAEIQDGQTGIHLRLDLLFLALVAGLTVIVGAMAGVVFMP